MVLYDLSEVWSHENATNRLRCQMAVNFRRVASRSRRLTSKLRRMCVDNRRLTSKLRRLTTKFRRSDDAMLPAELIWCEWCDAVMWPIKWGQPNKWHMTMVSDKMPRQILRKHERVACCDTFTDGTSPATTFRMLWETIAEQQEEPDTALHTDAPPAWIRNKGVEMEVLCEARACFT
jgi:hypothetical protein